MNPNFQNLANEIIFWFHLLFVIFATLVGLFLPPAFVVLLVVLHRIHILVFRGCILSKIQRYLGGLSDDVNFFQFASKKVAGKDISLFQSRIIGYIFPGLALIVAFAK